jgi:hypothetical protein
MGPPVLAIQAGNAVGPGKLERRTHLSCQIHIGRKCRICSILAFKPVLTCRPFGLAARRSLYSRAAKANYPGPLAMGEVVQWFGCFCALIGHGVERL